MSGLTFIFKQNSVIIFNDCSISSLALAKKLKSPSKYIKNMPIFLKSITLFLSLVKELTQNTGTLGRTFELPLVSESKSRIEISVPFHDKLVFEISMFSYPSWCSSWTVINNDNVIRNIFKILLILLLQTKGPCCAVYSFKLPEF